MKKIRKTKNQKPKKQKTKTPKNKQKKQKKEKKQNTQKPKIQKNQKTKNQKKKTKTHNQKAKPFEDNWIPVIFFLFLVFGSRCRDYCCMSMYYIRSNFYYTKNQTPKNQKTKKPKKQNQKTKKTKLLTGIQLFSKVFFCILFFWCFSFGIYILVFHIFFFYLV